MSGPLKLKIKLKQRPQEPEFAPGPSNHKRKRDEYSPQPLGVPTSAANGHRSEVKRPKKQKQHQQVASQLQIPSSGNKVKLHIKGPWSKAASASDSKDSPLRQSSSGHPHSQGKGVNQGSSVVLKQRPPAKAVQVLGQADPAQAFQPPSKKPKLKLKQQQRSSAADGALGANATDRTSSLDAAPGIKSETAPGQVEAPMTLIPKSEGNSAVAIPTQAVLERIVDKMQRKDNFNIFKEPVTEAMVCTSAIQHSFLPPHADWQCMKLCMFFICRHLVTFKWCSVVWTSPQCVQRCRVMPTLLGRTFRYSLLLQRMSITWSASALTHPVCAAVASTPLNVHCHAAGRYGRDVWQCYGVQHS